MARIRAESDATAENRTKRPILDAGIGRFVARLRDAIGSGSIREFASRTGMSEGALRMYLRGDSLPTLDRLDQIAAAAGLPPAWFIGVEGSPQTATALDERTLRLALEMVENVASLLGSTGPAWLRADIVVRVYELLAQAPDQPAAMIHALQLVRAELAPTAPAAQPAQSPAQPPAAEAPTLHKRAPLV